LIARAHLWTSLALGLALACTAAPASAQQRRDAGSPFPHLDLSLKPDPGKATSKNETRCEQCHTTSAWDHATFDHDKTGFPLRGAHVGAACKNCHAVDFTEPIGRTCVACHQDPHRGEFGTQCLGCHKEQSWVPLFNVDAHRRTNFPLVGRHASIPCTECHIAMTDRSFQLSTVACLGCHQGDFNGTASTQVNHIQLGFSTACAACHTSVTWSGAHFPAHDACFQIIGGAHANIQCLQCHPSLAGATITGTCATVPPAACSSCHAHVCSKMDALHSARRVPGYQCSDQKCYSCHRIVSSP
jgi:hypothetical protein